LLEFVQSARSWLGRGALQEVVDGPVALRRGLRGARCCLRGGAQTGAQLFITRESHHLCRGVLD
jgi:hypothetical protein